MARHRRVPDAASVVTDAYDRWVATMGPVCRLCEGGHKMDVAVGRCSRCSPRPRGPNKQSGVTARLRGISAVSDRVAWASGSGGTIVRTADGGATWQRLTVPDAAKLDFRDIDAVSDDTAYALSIGSGESSRIYKTTRCRQDVDAAVHQHRSESVFRRDGVLGRRARPGVQRFGGRPARDPEDRERRAGLDASAGSGPAAGARERGGLRRQRH